MTARGNARLSGVLLLGLLATLVIWRSTTGSIDTDVDGFQSSLNDLIEGRQRFLLGLAALLVAGVCSASLAGPLYLAFQDRDRSLALVGAFALAGLAMTLTVMFIAGFALDQLAQTSPRDPATETVARATALLMKGGRDAAFGAFLPLILLAFGGLIVRKAELPRWLGWLAVASGILNLLFWLDPISPTLGVVGRIGFVAAWIWLLAMGVAMMRSGMVATTAER
jgi:hypothetical protein